MTDVKRGTFDDQTSNRELLERAANAFGLHRAKYYRHDPGNGFPVVECITHYIDDEPCIQHWSSLTSDGDAFRLAITLGIIWGRYGNSYWARMDIDTKVFSESGERPNGNQDPMDAIRRAITRAAAEWTNT